MIKPLVIFAMASSLSPPGRCTYASDMRRASVIAFVAATLAGCAAPAHLVAIEGDVYILRTKSVATWNVGGGVYAAGLSARADVQCPAGWNKVGESVKEYDDYWLVEWHVRCH